VPKLECIAIGDVNAFYGLEFSAADSSKR